MQDKASARLPAPCAATPGQLLLPFRHMVHHSCLSIIQPKLLHHSGCSY
jgi:hypothetical protein